MLKPKALAKVFEQANTGGTVSTQLLNRDGVLMAYTGPPERQSQVSSAVASSIWDVYDKGGKAVLAGEHLDFLLIDCEGGKVAIKPVANLLLCVYCNDSVGVGMLKKKITALAAHLDQPLAQLVPEDP